MVQPYFISQAQGGVGLKHVTKGILNNAVFGLAPEKEQHRIVAKVDELMALCDQLEQEQADHQATHQTLVETLLNGLVESATLRQAQGEKDSTERPELVEGQSTADYFNQLIAEHFETLFTTEQSIDQLKQTILQLAVMGKLVPQDPNDEPASVLLEKIAEEKAKLIEEGKVKKQKSLAEIKEDEKPFELPDGWEWVRLGSIFTFLNGYAFKSDWFIQDGIKLLRNINIGHGRVHWKDKVTIPLEIVDEYERFNLSAGDIVISLDRPIINTGLKYAVIHNDDLPCLLLQRVAKFHSIGDKVEPNFLSRWLESEIFIRSIDPGRSNGVPHISTRQLEMGVFPFFAQAEQHRIVTNVNQLLTLCDSLKANLNQAQTTQTQLADAIVKQAVN
jgi:type I restriction enzyme S subunit